MLWTLDPIQDPILYRKFQSKFTLRWNLSTLIGWKWSCDFIQPIRVLQFQCRVNLPWNFLYTTGSWLEKYSYQFNGKVKWSWLPYGAATGFCCKNNKPHITWLTKWYFLICNISNLPFVFSCKTKPSLIDVNQSSNFGHVIQLTQLGYFNKSGLKLFKIRSTENCLKISAAPTPWLAMVTTWMTRPSTPAQTPCTTQTRSSSPSTSTSGIGGRLNFLTMTTTTPRQSLPVRCRFKNVFQPLNKNQFNKLFA